MHSPEHRLFACALRYDPGTGTAPKVQAAGKGAIARRIIETARQAGVEIKEDPTLASLLEPLAPFQEIPPELFRPVALLLAAVYEASGRLEEIRSNIS